MSDEGPAKPPARRGQLRLGDIKRAQELAAEGQMTQADIEGRYPGWEEAATRLGEATRAALEGPGRATAEAMAAAMKQIDLSRLGLGETMRRAAESVVRLDGLADAALRSTMTELPPIRSPVDATYRVVDEVRELAGIASGMAENTRASAEIAQSSLDQTAALLTAVGSLHDTTRAGIEAGEKRDARAEKRENALVRLTWALVGLGALLLVLTAALLYLTWVLVLREGAA
jgi:hypothetical protein